jgi:HSP20 family protein
VAFRGIIEEEKDYIIKASLPGVPPAAVEISLADNMLTLKGEVKEDKEIKEEHYRMRERHYGSFIRCVTLPAGVEADKVEATSENGVVTLRLPKSQATTPKKIAVKQANEPQKGE